MKKKNMLLTFILLLLVAVAIGALLADRLMPKGMGEPSHMLALHSAGTDLDRMLAPLLADHPGQTGAVLLSDGLAAFAARVLITRGAGRSLDLQYYMWHHDLAGRLLMIEIWRAAERGVRVRLLLDDMNAHGQEQQMLALSSHPNIEVRVYNPMINRGGIRRLLEIVVRAFRVNHRMHNKAWIADGRAAIVGGRNIGDEYFAAATNTNFHDLDMLLLGSAVTGAGAIFDTFWNSPAVVPIRELSRRDEKQAQKLIAETTALASGNAAHRYLDRVRSSPDVRAFLARETTIHWVDDIEIVSDPPQKWSGTDHNQWLASRLSALLSRAQRAAWLISPYFVPGESGTAGFLQLRRQGVAVGVVTNSLAANDVLAVHSGYARHRQALLAGNVVLHELRAQGKSAGMAGIFGSSGASLHTKAFVVDGERGFVGSFNLDPRSVNLNTEMGVLFNHAGLGAAIQAEYQRLASPALSYEVQLDPNGALSWLDDTTQIDHEPDASLFRRATAKALGWLPLDPML
ncbi:MAG: phospholipase D family protein [Opitutaceae bacterium]|nr:phospholipase D family protein [Opitutaceae bacterium]